MYQQKEIESLQANLLHAKKQVDTVSKQRVEWHVYHCLLVISGICYLIEQSDPKDYHPKFSFLKWGILTTGIIPRGKAKAPKKVVPPEVIDSNEMEILFTKVKNQLIDLENRAKNQFYTHHLFGDLNRETTIHFIGIHTKHHLKIIRDIIST